MHRVFKYVRGQHVSVEKTGSKQNTRSSFPALVALALATSYFSACKPSESAENNTQFANFTDTGSQYYLERFYTKLSTQQYAKLCIGLVGFDPQSIEAQNYSVFALRSLRRWLVAVKNSPSWQQAQIPTIHHHVQDTACDAADSLKTGDFSVTLFKTQQAFVATMCGIKSPLNYSVDNMQGQPLDSRFCNLNVGYSAGTPGLGAVYISPLIGSKQRAPIMESSIMHEFGHSFGLGDTYNSLGVTYNGTMGKSLMRYSGGTELYPDDMAGLETAIAFAKTGVAACNGKTLEGTSGYLFCNPSKNFIELVNKQHIDNSDNALSDSTGTESKTETSYQARITFNQETWLKSDPHSQGNDLPNEKRCLIPLGVSLVVTIYPQNKTANHQFYRADPSLAACPNDIGKEGYFFIPHIMSETKI